MTTESEQWFFADECRTDAEREFVAAMAERARAWHESGVTPDDLRSLPAAGKWLLFVDVCAPAEGHVLRTLRVELIGDCVVMGDDETGQGTHDLDVSRPGVVACDRGAAQAGTLADCAANWIELQLRRPVERHEWHRAMFVHRRWILADTNQGLSWSDSQNERRSELGLPDLVHLVRGAR